MQIGVQVRSISPAQTYLLRQCVLRPNLPISESKFATDFAVKSYHWGLFLHDEADPRSVLSFAFEKSPLFEERVQFRLRGMATHPKFQGQGYGKTLLLTAISNLYQNEAVQLIWFNARKNAYRFYEKLGFQFKTDEFELPSIGPHRVMFQGRLQR